MVNQRQHYDACFPITVSKQFLGIIFFITFYVPTKRIGGFVTALGIIKDLQLEKGTNVSHISTEQCHVREFKILYYSGYGVRNRFCIIASAM